MSYETVIGLEVHAQLLTKSKLFCPCSTEFGRRPNENTCPVCLSLPGVLPVLNRQAVEFAIRAGLATGCRISTKNIFARKNYFYPDLPKGYQISQYERPICTQGWVEIDVDGSSKKVGLTRIHMEEDAGKLLHEHPGTRSKTASWVDLNRAGVPLVEIVSEPDIRSPQEAIAYLKELRRIVMYVGICDGNMEEGSFRCDANISLRPAGQKEFGTKVELKNMNSFRHIEKALQYEIRRQTEILEGRGEGRIVQETRLWDPEGESTHSMRSKEEAHDYRYFPDPDLLPLEVDEAWIAKVRDEMPELPRVKRLRFIADYRIPPPQAEILTDSRPLADFYEACLKGYDNPSKVANWVINEFLRMIGGDPLKIKTSRLKPDHVAPTLRSAEEGKISGGIAKSVLQKVFETGKDPEALIREEGLTQVSDAGSLEKIVSEILAENPKEVERLKGGEQKLISFFLGQAMQKTKGRADPKQVREILTKKIGS